MGNRSYLFWTSQFLEAVIWLDNWKVTRRWHVSHTCQTPTIWKLIWKWYWGWIPYCILMWKRRYGNLNFFFTESSRHIFNLKSFSQLVFTQLYKKKSHLIRKIAALLYFCILRIPVYKVYLSLLLWSMFAFTIFCYLFIPPCLLTHYFVYLTSCYRFIYVLVCFPIKRKTWRTR